MSRLACLFTIFTLLIVQSGCQLGSVMRLSQGQSTELPTDVQPTQNQLASHKQPFKTATQTNSFPLGQLPAGRQPLGYRRGYQPCNT